VSVGSWSIWLRVVAALVLALVAMDVVRQLQLGEADLGLAIFTTATCVGVVAAIAVGR
jgi:hypothetical protein